MFIQGDKYEFGRKRQGYWRAKKERDILKLKYEIKKFKRSQKVDDYTEKAKKNGRSVLKILYVVLIHLMGIYGGIMLALGGTKGSIALFITALVLLVPMIIWHLRNRDNEEAIKTLESK